MPVRSGEAETYGLTEACPRAPSINILACHMVFGQLLVEVCTEAHRQSARRSSVVVARSVIWKPGVCRHRAILTKRVVRKDLERRLRAMHLYVVFGRACEIPNAFVVEQALGGLEPVRAVWVALLGWTLECLDESWCSASGKAELSATHW